MPHRLRLALRVHQDPVPAVQPDRGVVGVTDVTSNAYARIAQHCTPAPASRPQIAGDDLLVLRSRDTIRVSGADVNCLASGAVAEFGPMRLSAIAPSQRLMAQDQLLVHNHLSNWQKEPLALAAVSSVLTAVAGVGPESLASLSGLNFGRLQGFLGLPHGADGSTLGNPGHKPVAFIVAAEELALVLAVTDQEQQVSVAGLHVEQGDLGFGIRTPCNLEELALSVGLHVQGNNACRAAAPGRTISDFQPSANAGELDVEKVRVHKREDTITAGAGSQRADQ